MINEVVSMNVVAAARAAAALLRRRGPARRAPRLQRFATTTACLRCLLHSSASSSCCRYSRCHEAARRAHEPRNGPPHRPRGPQTDVASPPCDVLRAAPTNNGASPAPFPAVRNRRCPGCSSNRQASRAAREGEMSLVAAGRGDLQRLGHPGGPRRQVVNDVPATVRDAARRGRGRARRREMGWDGKRRKWRASCLRPKEQCSALPRAERDGCCTLDTPQQRTAAGRQPGSAGGSWRPSRTRTGS